MTHLMQRPAAPVLRTATALALLTVAAALAGCGASKPDDNLFETNGPSEVGATDFAVISVTRWNDIESELQPNFQLDENTALRMVMPVVGSGASADTESSRFALTATESASPFNLAGPGRGGNGGNSGNGNSGHGGGNSGNHSGSSRNGGGQSGSHAAGSHNNGGGKTGVKSATVLPPEDEYPDGLDGPETESAGETSTSNRGARNTRGNLPGLANIQSSTVVQAGGPVGIEPQLQYTLATALLQFVRMTNHYVQDMVDKQGAHAYVVRMQITLMPLSREMHYDTFTDIAFFGASPSGEISPIQVVPLLATDSLEGIMRTNTASSSHDLALSLQALFGGGGAGFDAEKLSEKLDALSGEDKNSVLTMGRVTDNTVRVRLGAMAQPSGKYVMVPRTCTVPVVLLVRGETAASPPTVVHAVTKTIFVNSITGKLLRGRAHSESLTHLAPIRDSYRLLNVNKPYVADHAKLIQLADAGDVVDFSKLVWDLDKPPASRTPGEKMSDDMASISELWLEAVSLCSTDAVQMLQFSLPRIEESHLPPADQTATLYDDGEKSQVMLHGGAALHQLALQGVLDIKPNAAARTPKMRLYALDKPLFSPDHQDLIFTFPSLRSASIDTARSGFIDPKNLVLTVTSSALEGPAKNEKPVETQYDLVMLSANPLPSPPPPVRIGHLLLIDPVTTAAGTPEVGPNQQVTLKINSLDGIPPGCRLVASGADITGLTPSGILVQDKNGWTIEHVGEIHATLSNVTQPQVQFYLVDAAGNRIATEQPITIAVAKKSAAPGVGGVGGGGGGGGRSPQKNPKGSKE